MFFKFLVLIAILSVGYAQYSDEDTSLSQEDSAPQDSERSARQLVNGCSLWNGCHKGYCWAGCWTGFNPLPDTQREWCYTTRGSSQDHNYVRCSNDNECDGCWRCAGPCTL